MEAEEELNEDDKRSPILKSEVVKGIKQCERKKFTGDDNIPDDLLKDLGDNGFKIMIVLANKIYMSGDWPKNFLDVMMIALPKKYQAKKCSDQRTIALTSHTGRIVAHIHINQSSACVVVCRPTVHR